MAAIRPKNTGPELALRRALWAQGVRGWRCHVRSIPGTPDVAFTRWRIAVFVDGAFWHGHPDHYHGQSGPFWDEKIQRNRDRDVRVNSQLSALGWHVLRLWDFEVASEPDRCVARIRELLSEVRDSGQNVRD